MHSPNQSERLFLPLQTGLKYSGTTLHSSNRWEGPDFQRKQVCNDHWTVKQWHRGGDSNKWLWIKFQFVQEAVANQEGHCPRSSSATSKIPQLPAPDAAQAGSCFHRVFFSSSLIALCSTFSANWEISTRETSDAPGCDHTRHSGL